MKLETVEMVHPDLPGQPYRAPQQAVGMLQRSGWKVAADVPPDDQAETPPDPPAPDEPTEAPAKSGASSLEGQPRRRRAKEGE